MGCGNITVYDHDTAEEHNLPNQFALVSCLGQPKVEALKALAEQLAEVEIRGISERYRGQRLEGVIICAVDSMDARGVIWKNVKGNRRVQLYLDARMRAARRQAHSPLSRTALFARNSRLCDLNPYCTALYGHLAGNG